MTLPKMWATEKKEATLRDIERWHDLLLSFIEADERAREVWHEDYRMAVGVLSYLAARNQAR